MKVSRDTDKIEKLLWIIIGTGIAFLALLIAGKVIASQIEKSKLDKPLRDVVIFKEGELEIDCDYVLDGKKVIGKRNIEYIIDGENWEYRESESTIQNKDGEIIIDGKPYGSVDDLEDSRVESYNNAMKAIEVIKKANFNIGADLDKKQSSIKMNGDAKLSLEVNNNNIVNLLSICGIYLRDNNKETKINVECYYKKSELNSIVITYNDFMNSMIAYTQAKRTIEGSNSIVTGHVEKLVFTLRQLREKDR